MPPQNIFGSPVALRFVSTSSSMHFAAWLALCTLAAASAAPILLTTADMARRFDGVGGISGGGATSPTFFDYPDASRSVMLDLLWKPQYGASMQTVKVEVPADADTTCGSEVAHRHDQKDGGSCYRGYEGWFLSEAVKRVPGITSSSLQWAAPSFVGQPDVVNGKSFFTRTNAEDYVVPWLRCMSEAWGVNLTYMGGGWNERPFNVSYIKLLRAVLDGQGEWGQRIGISAADDCCGSNWGIAYAMAADPALAAAVNVISTHVAGSFEENTPTPPVAVALGVPLWQGEEHIGLPDPNPVPIWEWGAAGSVGVEISQNWVANNMTATIYWPAVYGWVSGIMYRGKGFLVASSPWGSAPYFVPTALWVMAHTTHFTTAGTSWLLGGSGSGHLGTGRTVLVPHSPGAWNVSYVTYVDPTGPLCSAGACPFTLVIESFIEGGVWTAGGGGGGVPYSATFALGGNLTGWANKPLHVWVTNATTTFQRQADVVVGPDGTWSVTIEPGAIHTYTTVESAHPGAAALLASLPHPPMPAAWGDAGPADAPFPLPYADDFEGYGNDTLPLFISDMFGAYTVWTGASSDSEWVAPLRSGHADAEVRAAVACSQPEHAAARPSRCVRALDASAHTNTASLRQYTRAPPIGWGSSSTNMAAIIGNSSLHNIALSVAALIETVDPDFPPPATPYVLIGINGGSGTLGGSDPGSFYRQDPAFDFFWVNVEGRWGCSFTGTPNVCADSYPLPGNATFGYDAWHQLTQAETPAPGGGNVIVLTFDGAVLANVTQTPAQMRNGGSGGYAGLVSGCHRTQWDNLLITSTA